MPSIIFQKLNVLRLTTRTLHYPLVILPIQQFPFVLLLIFELHLVFLREDSVSIIIKQMRNLGFHFHQLFFKYQYFSLTQVKVSFLILFKFSTNSKLANCELLGKSASIHLYQFSQTLRLQVESDEL